MKGRLVDLTLPLFDGAPIWSPEPKTMIADFFTIGRQYGAREDMNMKVLYMCGHAGTHCDAPKHLREGKPSLDEIPLERYVGKASVVHLPDKGFDDPWIMISDLEHLADIAHIRLGDIQDERVHYEGQRADLDAVWRRYTPPSEGNPYTRASQKQQQQMARQVVSKQNRAWARCHEKAIKRLRESVIYEVVPVLPD